MSKGENSKTTSYRSIFKATSLFGGVQVYKILIGIINAKFVAVLLGPVGMGIQGLYQSAIQLIQSFSSLGLSQSAVRDVSEASGSGDTKQIGLTVSVIKRLVWITGLFGLVLTAVFSPVLSRVTFGNYDYTIPFIFLSVILLLDQLSAGRIVVLQGMRKLKSLAKSTSIGSTIGLIVSVPIYYFFGVKGVVPTLILNSLTMLALTSYFAKKVEVEKKQVTNREMLQHGKSMMKMGIAMSVNTILVTSVSYLLRGFIRYEGGTEQVGLFAAGYLLVNSSVSMVFHALSTDYYPRLSMVNHDNEKCRQIINQQGEMAILIIAPIIVLCMILMPFIVKIIYSDKFSPATDYINWAILGLMFRAFSWVIAYCFLAKAESKLYIINETIKNTYALVFGVAGYHFYGLAGVGAAFVLTNLVYSIQVLLIAKKRYGFFLDSSYKKILSVLLVIIIASFALVLSCQYDYMYIPLAVLFVCCSVYSFVELNRRMDIMKMLFKRS